MPYLLATATLVAAALVVAVALSLRTLPQGRRCPACGSHSLPLRFGLLRLLSLGSTPPVVLRWCPRCGWQGLFRRDSTGSEPSAPGARTGELAGRDALPVRSIRLSGAPWEVRLRCWHQDGVWLGRLLFVSPSGRIWSDPRPGFCGTSISGVIGQAASLPDPALAGRLQQLISE